MLQQGKATEIINSLDLENTADEIGASSLLCSIISPHESQKKVSNESITINNE
jgi:hypothetical protein